MLLHFVGSAPGSTDLVSFLERLLKETGQLKVNAAILKIIKIS